MQACIQENRLSNLATTIMICRKLSSLSQVFCATSDYGFGAAGPQINIFRSMLSEFLKTFPADCQSA